MTEWIPVSLIYLKKCEAISCYNGMGFVTNQRGYLLRENERYIALSTINRRSLAQIVNQLTNRHFKLLTYPILLAFLFDIASLFIYTLLSLKGIA